MKQLKPQIVVITILFINIFVRCDLSIFSENDDKILQGKLNKIIENSKKNPSKEFEFRMDTITKFKWEKMYSFVHLDSKEDIDKKLGFKWNINFQQIGEKDNLFVFVLRKEVVSYVVFSASNNQKKEEYIGSNIHTFEYFTPQNAIFYFYKLYYPDKTYLLCLSSKSIRNKYNTK
jgi:hypothetical protein